MINQWSAADVLAYFDKPTPTIEKNYFFEALQSPKTFCHVMSLIQPEQRDFLFNLCFSTLLSQISNVDDFVKIALYLTPQQKQTLWENISPIEIKNLLELAKLLKLLEPSCYPVLLQSTEQLQKTGLEVGMLLGMLSLKQKEALRDWIGKIIPDLIILSSEDFQHAMQNLNDAQKKILFDRVWLTLPGMIQDSHGFERVFSCLSPVQSSLLLLSVDLSGICVSTLDRLEILKSLHKNQLKRLYISFPEDAAQWGVILGQLDEERLQILINKFPKNLYNGRAFAELQMLNSPQARNKIFDLFRHQFSLLIKNANDMMATFRYLDGGQKDFLWQRFAYEIHHWIKQEPAFFRLFANEHPDLFEFFQRLPNRFQFVMAVLSEKPERIKQQFDELLKPNTKSSGQFFPSRVDISDLLEALCVLNPRRCAILNQALGLGLDRLALLSEDAFKQALLPMVNPALENTPPSLPRRL